MANMGIYCKAYPIGRLREFSAWTENSQGTRREKKELDGRDVEVARELTNDDFLYLQENFTVTDGIFLDENIIFDQVTPEWIDFCKGALNFSLPDNNPIQVSDT